ncbi:MAG: FliM/FliN family flagellar motor switch protein [Candidatus Margulisiibacteriota bacterium]
MATIKKGKKAVLLPGAIGDWTKYKPQIEETAKIKASSKSPNRFSEKELLDMDILFLNIFEEYTKAVQKTTGLSMSAVSCSIETDNYAEILKSVNIPVVQFKVTSPEVEPLFLCFDMTLANALINSSVGGQTDLAPAKSLTEIEENILELCASSGADKLLGGLSKNIEVKYLNSPNIYFDQSIEESAVLVLGRSQINFGKLSGQVFLISHLSTAQDILFRSKNKIAAPDISKIPVAITGKITMPVSSVLGSTMISAKELYELEAGDVIVLDSSINNLLHISIGEDLNILGQPGIKDDRLCVQILKNGNGKVEKIKLSAEV